MNETEKKIRSWHNETFPNATKKAMFEKLKEELDEACWETHGFVDIPDNIFNMMLELADVYIVAVALAEKCGFTFDEFILSKLAINKQREWGEENSEGDRPREK